VTGRVCQRGWELGWVKRGGWEEEEDKKKEGKGRGKEREEKEGKTGLKLYISCHVHRTHREREREREIMLFIGKPKGIALTHMHTQWRLTSCRAAEGERCQRTFLRNMKSVHIGRSRGGKVTGAQV